MSAVGWIFGVGSISLGVLLIPTIIGIPMIIVGVLIVISDIGGDT